MKVTTDACLFGAWAVERINGELLPIKTVLDIGTGTGLLALMLAQKINAIVDAIEIEPNAFEQAKENIEASPWKDRVNIFQGDATQFTFPSQYDVIISNPPFYENELASPDKEKNMAHHDSGLLLNELIQKAGDTLSPHGRLYLLLPSKRMIEAGLLLQKSHFHVTHTTVVRQSPQHNPTRVFISANRAVSDNESYTKNELSICNQNKEYTPEFVELLKDYYLYL